MYIGSIEKARDAMWLYDPKEGRMTKQTVEYVPALYKIFDDRFSSIDETNIIL